MKIPPKVRITSKVSYEICYLDDDDTRYGFCDEEKKQIFLCLSQTKTEMVQTLIHEIIHALEFEYSIQIPHKSIHQLELPLYKFLKLNGLI